METGIGGLGRYAGPGTLILSSLASGPKHGYALITDIEEFARERLRPGTLYGALARLEHGGLIEALDTDGRRRPYRLTDRGAVALQEQLASQRHIANVGLGRLSAGLAAS